MPNPLASLRSSFVLLCMLSVATSPAWSAVSEPRPGSSIEVSAEAEVEVAPDLAVLELAVRTQAETAAAAARENGERMRAVLEVLRKTLGAGADLQTGSYTLRPNYAPPREGAPAQVTGYVATNTVQVKTAELARLGELIDAGIRAGANQVQRVSFTVRDQSVPRRDALRNAVAAARAKADTLAEALGLKLSAFHSLVEQDVGEVRPLMREAALGQFGGAASTPVEPGLIRVRARVVLTMLASR